MFIPLTHAAGEAQADFCEALVVVAGVEQKAHYLAVDLPHSDDCFVAAFPAETTEAFLEGHVRAFVFRCYSRAASASAEPSALRDARCALPGLCQPASRPASATP
jgi:hypothetical protein